MAILLDKPKKISEDHYLLRINNPGEAPVPGQFINIRVGTGTDPLVRRPFSVFNFENEITEIVIRIIGKGTQLLADSAPGEIDILGPRGKGFTLNKNEKVLLIGGGVGNAPLYFLARCLKELGNNVTYIYGSRSSEYIYSSELFRSSSDKLIISTDNGSEGEKGYAADAAAELMKSETFDRIYTCGPTVMMKAVVQLAADRCPVEVSVENYFGCGIGLCVGCTIETTSGFQRACINGPVFNGSDIKWETMSD